MVNERGSDSERDGNKADEIEKLFGQYVDRLNAGEPVLPDEVLFDHPTCGQELIETLQAFLSVGDSPPADLSRVPLGTLGDYTLRRQIGRGGMGVVYEAWENSMDRRVALKVLPAGMAADDRAVMRFVREARLAGKLNHPNVVGVYGMGVKEQTPYYAMEFVEGKTLAQILQRLKEAKSEAETLFGKKEEVRYFATIAEVFAAVADGLQHAHSKGVVHRDIKPSNLIFDSKGCLRILDFGLAHLEGQASLTISGDVVGTPLYMSPEQARRKKIPVDHRTDIYSLGATIYEMLTWRPPFMGEDHQDTLSQIIEQDPWPLRRLNPSIPRDLETIVLKCLRKDPKARYQTAEALACDLRGFARGDPIEARPWSRWRVLARWMWRNRVRVGAAVVMPALLLLLYLLSPTEEITTRRLLTSQDMDLNNFLDMRPSPDGRQIAYSRMGTDGSLCVRDLESGTTTQLMTGEFTYTGDDGPVWSPDGKRIAYCGEQGVLKIVDVASKTSSIPKGTEGLKLTPWDWSPDGNSLLCAKLDEGVPSIVSLSLGDGAITTLVSGRVNRPWGAVFSRDGRYIAYSAIENGNQDVFVMASDGSEQQRISDTPGSDTNPLWSPSGDTLIYKDQDGIWSVGINEGRATGKPRFLKSLEFWHTVGWTEEAGIFYVTWDNVQTFYSLPVDARTGTASGEPILLLDRPVKNAHRCAWSPDMKSIAFTEQHDGQLQIFSTTEGSLRSFALANKTRPDNLWWSRDGTRILYVPRGTESKTVFAVDIATGKTEPLFAPMTGVDRFHVSPDGETLLYYRWNGERNDRRRELIVSEIGNTDGRVLAAEQEENVGRFSNWVRPAFSPDGGQILFVTENGNLWLAAADGSERRILATAVAVDLKTEGMPTRFVHFAAWHPQGDYVVYDNLKALYVVKVETGEQHDIPLPENIIEYVDGVWQWSPDGTQILFTGGRGRGPELWTIKNILDTQPTDK